MFTRMKLARLQRGIAQWDLATKSGIQQSRLSMLENGRLQPRSDELERLSRALGVAERELSSDEVGPEAAASVGVTP